MDLMIVCPAQNEGSTHSHPLPKRRGGFNQTMLIMKLTAIVLLSTCMHVYATGNAQITLAEKNVPLQKVFKKIQKQSGYDFLYSYELLQKEGNVSVRVNNVSVQQALTACLAGKGLSFEIQGSTVVIMKKKEELKKAEPPPPPVEITGRITDEKGEPVAGVTVMLKGTSTGTTTDAQGNFKLTIPSLKGRLVFSHIGYVGAEVVIGSNTVIDLQLKEEPKSLNDIVVVGYGTQRRGDITAAVASVKSKDFVQGPAPDAASLIRGKVPGLSVVTTDANPTSGTQINLRGITTLMASTNPLIIIDGVPGTLTTIAPEDIESIDVLKDGSAAAIYGTRGTNGVILITTKKVHGETPPTVDVNTYFTIQKITRRLDFMDAGQYRRLVAQNKPGATDYGGNTNWFNEVSRTPLSQVYNISLKGGSRNTNYSLNLNYRNLQGIMKKSDNRVIFPRLEVNHSMFDGVIKFNANINGYQQQYFAGTDGGTYNPQVYRNALTYNPTDRVKDSTGNWTERVEKTDYKNPVSLLEETVGINQNTTLRTSGSIIIQPVKQITVNVLASRDLFNSTRGYYETKKHYSTIYGGRNGYASRGTTRSTEDLLEATAQYSNTFTVHKITGLIGYSWRKNNYQNYYMQNWDFPTDAFSYNNMGAGQALQRGQGTEVSYQSANKLIGYFARINYTFLNRYMLMASIRREGSSKFGADHKWGNFPAVSVGWNMQDENFMRNISFLSNLKLRAGFGVTGTEPADPYMSLDRINFNDYVLINGVWSPVITPSTNPNPDLRWERKQETNIGMDFGFLNNRISGSIDVYKRTTKDLLWRYAVSTPPYLYNTIVANAASMENRGIELQLNAIPVSTDAFQWNTSVIFSTNKNKLLTFSNDKFQLASGYSDEGDTGEPIQQRTHRVQVGQPIGNFYGYKTVDVDANGHWIIEGKDGKPKPIADQTADDKKILGNGLPKHYLAFNNTFQYKNLDLTITMRGAFGFQILNTARMFYEVPVMLTRGNLLASAYDNIYGKHPLADDQELQLVSYYIEDGDYWKIDNVTLGYNVNMSDMSIGKYVKRVRVYASATNLKAFTKYKGIDPEVNISGLTPGFDDKNRYPAAASFTLGAFLTF